MCVPVCVCVCVCSKLILYTWGIQYASRLFCAGIQNCRRHLKIHYVIAIHLMR